MPPARLGWYAIVTLKSLCKQQHKLSNLLSLAVFETRYLLNFIHPKIGAKMSRLSKITCTQFLRQMVGAGSPYMVVQMYVCLSNLKGL